MTISLKHAYVAAGTDSGRGEVHKAQWNADHNLTMATARILGRKTAGDGSVEELTAADVKTLVGVDMAKSVYDPTNINSSAFSMDNMIEGTNTKILTSAERTKLASTALTLLASQTPSANKVIMYSGSNAITFLDFKDEDDMVSNSATSLPSQQSVKAYVDNNIKGPRAYGAIPDTGNDMTTPLQNIINAVVAGTYVPPLEPGIYLVDNLSIPYDSGYDSNPTPFDHKIAALLGWPGATIKKRNSADNDYLVATARWISNSTFTAGPFIMDGIRLDGAGIAKDVFINTGYAVKVTNCVITGGRRHGIYEPVTGKGGASIGSSRAVGQYFFNRIYNNGFESNGTSSGLSGTGVRVEYSASAFITDYWFCFNQVYDNQLCNFNVDQIAGWKIMTNHMWHHAVVPDAGATYSARVGLGLSAVIEGNVWEGYSTQTFGLCIDSPSRVSSNNDVFLGGLGCLVSFASTTNGRTRVANGRFEGNSSNLQHGYNNASCLLVSSGNSFQNTVPYSWSAGNTLGIIDVLYDTYPSSTNEIFGRQRTDGVLIFRPPNGNPVGIAYPTASSTLTVNSVQSQIYVTVLAADVTINLPTVALADAGLKFRFTRFSTATGAFNLLIKNSGGTTVGTLSSASTFLDIEFDGANWRITGKGSA